MGVIYSDHEIDSLVQENKPVPADWRNRVRLRPKRGHNERYLDLAGVAGSEFRLILRQSQINPLDFSVILAARVPRSNQIFRLRRYNGRSHEHTNHIEGMTFTFISRRRDIRNLEPGRTPTPSRPTASATSAAPSAV